MTGCGDHLGFVQRRELARTFRYGESIIVPSSAFIQRNPEQTRRALRGPERRGGDGLVIVAAADQIVGAAQAMADIAARVSSQQDASVLILGRYNRSLHYLRLRSPRPDIRLETSTVHSAKGREADYVIVLDLVDGRSGFPAQREDDPLLGMALSQSSSFPYAEERRLFYVALTRARRRAYLIADSLRPSPFVQELRRDQPAVPQLGAFAADDARPCPRCGGRLVLSQTGKTRRCTNHPLCGYKARRCDQCSRGFLIVIGGGRAECSNDACAAPVKACPRCKLGTLRLLEGSYGRFWGCTEYYAEPPCTYSRSAEPRAAAGRAQ